MIKPNELNKIRQDAVEEYRRKNINKAAWEKFNSNEFDEMLKEHAKLGHCGIAMEKIYAFCGCSNETSKPSWEEYSSNLTTQYEINRVMLENGYRKGTYQKEKSFKWD